MNAMSAIISPPLLFCTLHMTLTIYIGRGRWGEREAACENWNSNHVRAGPGGRGALVAENHPYLGRLKICSAA